MYTYVCLCRCYWARCTDKEHLNYWDGFLTSGHGQSTWWVQNSVLLTFHRLLPSSVAILSRWDGYDESAFVMFVNTVGYRWWMCVHLLPCCHCCFPLAYVQCKAIKMNKTVRYEQLQIKHRMVVRDLCVCLWFHMKWFLVIVNSVLITVMLLQKCCRGTWCSSERYNCLDCWNVHCLSCELC